MDQPNNPVELTAHRAGFLGYSLHLRLWAAAHRERLASKRQTKAFQLSQGYDRLEHIYLD
jgi:hypothetical protein